MIDDNCLQVVNERCGSTTLIFRILTIDCHGSLLERYHSHINACNSYHALMVSLMVGKGNMSPVSIVIDWFVVWIHVLLLCMTNIILRMLSIALMKRQIIDYDILRLPISILLDYQHATSPHPTTWEPDRTSPISIAILICRTVIQVIVQLVKNIPLQDRTYYISMSIRLRSILTRICFCLPSSLHSLIKIWHSSLNSVALLSVEVSD